MVLCVSTLQSLTDHDALVYVAPVLPLQYASLEVSPCSSIIDDRSVHVPICHSILFYTKKIYLPICSLFHTFITLSLLFAYWTGGSTHKLLLPFVFHNSLTIAGLLYTTPNPATKMIRKLTAGHVA